LTAVPSSSATTPGVEAGPPGPSVAPVQPVRVVLFALGILFSVTPFATPALALAAGIVLALTVGNPWPAATNASSGWLLQASVVGLGFGIPLANLLAAGAAGVGYTVMLIAGVFALGLVVGRWMAIDRTVSVLITAGTGICGGSAIAAVGPAIGASREAMSVALATVFVLNGVALYVFPPIGHIVGLSEHQFGVWAALAIHDTSSVVGAAASYGPVALHDATTLKLARALWILPLALVAPMLMGRRSGTRVQLPILWFIGFFVLASVARAAAEAAGAAGVILWFDQASRLARTALVLTLFLIGASLSRAQLRAVGARPFAYGALLWIVVGGATLAAVWWGIQR